MLCAIAPTQTPVCMSCTGILAEYRKPTNSTPPFKRFFLVKWWGFEADPRPDGWMPLSSVRELECFLSWEAMAANDPQKVVIREEASIDRPSRKQPIGQVAKRSKPT